MKQGQTEAISSGIETLVERLHNDGVNAGKAEAERIIAEAEKQAAKIVTEAEGQAAELLEAARASIATERQAAEEALHVAFRDLVLDMKNSLLQRLSDAFRQDVRNTVKRDDVMIEMVKEAVAKIMDESPSSESKDIKLLVPDALLPLEEIRENPEQAISGPLADMAFALRDEMMQQGIHFVPNPRTHHEGGFYVAFDEGSMQVDISDAAIAELLLSYLQPRFQAILDGVIR